MGLRQIIWDINQSLDTTFTLLVIIIYPKIILVKDDGQDNPLASWL